MEEGGGNLIDTEQMEWRELAPGVGIKVLRLDRAKGGLTIMVRAQKGSVLPLHRHIGLSEIYIVKGAGHHNETGNFKAGDYIIEPDGAVHTPLRFEEEVVLVMTAQGPSAFLNQDGSTAFMMDVDMLSHFAGEHTHIAAPV